MDYLYKEMPRKARANLNAHLQTCPACQQQVAAWRQTMQAMNEWKLPNRRLAAWTVRPLLKWGFAALLILGAGFAFGRFSAPVPPDLNTLRAALEPPLKSALATELRQELADDLVAKWQEAFQTNRAQLAVQLQQIQIAQYHALATQLERVESQHVADYADLRKDLETLALATQAAIQRAQSQIGQLVAFAQPVSLNSSPSNGADGRNAVLEDNGHEH